MRRGHLVLFLLIASLFGVQCRSVKAPRAPTPGVPHLRVLSYNVNFGLAGDPQGIAAIRRARADLAFLQETTPAWERALRRALGRRYPRMHFVHRPGAGGLAVLSRFAVREQQLIESPGGWFPAWRVVIDSPLGPLQVLQVHLRPPVSDGGSWVSGYFTTRGFRRREIAHFCRELDPSLPTLVLGDFNEDEDGRAVRYLEQRRLRDALASFAPDTPTWRWRISIVELSQALDHILHSPELDPLEVRVLREGRSDHFPLLAVFQRSKAPSPAKRHR
jgi:endonuclease/exonuclease/phosphatase (EEP) superfamily protein YafD